MADDVEEAHLPGVGVRYSFRTSAGVRVTVLHHHSGRRRVFVGDVRDPDAARQVMSLDDDDSHILAELLGGSRIVREIDRLQQTVSGLAIEWLHVPDGASSSGRTIGELEVRSTTGVTVVAAMRAGQAQPVPGPDFRVESGDTLVVMGEPEAIRRARDLLRR